ncbi:MAG: hypothetical protein ACJ757_02735 [Gaiellaceae bacterium]
MSTQEKQTQEQGKKHGEVHVTVDYLPATEDYKHEYPRQVVLETIRADAKNFFGVQDRTEGRDTYTYYLVHDGERIQNTEITLEQLIGEHAEGAHFSLVEEITTGGAAS